MNRSEFLKYLGATIGTLSLYPLLAPEPAFSAQRPRVSSTPDVVNKFSFQMYHGVKLAFGEAIDTQTLNFLEEKKSLDPYFWSTIDSSMIGVVVANIMEVRLGRWFDGSTSRNLENEEWGKAAGVAIDLDPRTHPDSMKVYYLDTYSLKPIGSKVKIDYSSAVPPDSPKILNITGKLKKGLVIELTKSDERTVLSTDKFTNPLLGPLIVGIYLRSKVLAKHNIKSGDLIGRGDLQTSINKETTEENKAINGINIYPVFIDIDGNFMKRPE